MSRRTPRLTPRQSRALAALLLSAWVARESLDGIVGASNSPDTAHKLRAKLGRDAIETQLVRSVDRDGKPCTPGRYRLTQAGRAALALLGLRPGNDQGGAAA